MKRFFNFLLFVALLSIAVGSLQLWKDRRLGLHRRWENPLASLFNPRGSEHHNPEKYTLVDSPRIDLKEVDVLAAMSRQRILLAKAVVPSVVSIVTSKSVPNAENQDSPFYEFFRRRQHLNKGDGNRIANQLGSGAIVSKEGHIVTNNHVIEGMDQIAVKLSDGREREARLIGTDPDTDIAVLKIDAGEEVTPLPFGDSELVEVGETVMAVGNPYGWEESVTQGIVSAKGRRGSENISDLFQIDAAINPGNSGGPLINVRGELIGLNEAIFSRTGAWAGVGFAIPSGTVRRVVDGILKTGRVIHGYLGVNGARTAGPPLVESVVTGSPAEKASIQPGDVIQKFNHKSVNDFEDLRRGVAEVNVDSTVAVELVRDGKTFSVDATIAEKPVDNALLSQAPRLPPGHPPVNGRNGRALQPPPGGAGSHDSGLLGAVVVRELAGGEVRKLKLPDNAHGVLVTDVDANSPAAARLQPGDLIETINQEPVANLDDYAKSVRTLTTEQMVVLSIIHERNRMVVVINPE